MTVELPPLPPCPTHPDGPVGCIADCRLCWERMYLKLEYTLILYRMNRRINEYNQEVERRRNT